MPTRVLYRSYKRDQKFEEGLVGFICDKWLWLNAKKLDLFRDSGIDSFWLDIKAYDDKVHHDLTGASNKWILKLPAEILERKFVLEVSSLYILGWVEIDQIRKIAELLAQVDSEIPYAIVAFFPEHEMTNVPSPNFQQMAEAFEATKDAGLKNVKLGNLGVFVKSNEEYEMLTKMNAI